MDFIKESCATFLGCSVAGLFFLQHYLMKLDLKPPSGYSLKKMPKILAEAAHIYTDLIIDETEFTFQYASNFELNSSMLSNCKNTQTVKSLVIISPSGAGIPFSDIFSGSVSDSKLLKNVVQFILLKTSMNL